MKRRWPGGRVADHVANDLSQAAASAALADQHWRAGRREAAIDQAALASRFLLDTIARWGADGQAADVLRAVFGETVEPEPGGDGA